MQRVTADTNIIISGLNFPGNARQLLASAEAGSIRLCVSPSILKEVPGVLQRNKFGWSSAEAQEAVEWISHIADAVQPKQEADAIKSDPHNNRILECALASRSDYIVSGDKHLPELRQFGHTRILKVAGFLEISEARGK